MRGGGIFPIVMTGGALLLALAVLVVTLPMWSGMVVRFIKYVRSAVKDSASVVREELTKDE